MVTLRPNMQKLFCIHVKKIHVKSRLVFIKDQKYNLMSLLEKLRFLHPEHLFLCPSNQALSTHQMFFPLNKKNILNAVSRKAHNSI